MVDDVNWEKEYKESLGSLPWDTGVTSPELIDYFDSLDNAPKQVLEIGCGTGTNAIWMTKKGSSVVATDISPTAISAAKKKQEEESLDIDFRVSDILKEKPLGESSVDFAFDRGVYHVMEPDDRKTFIDVVANLLKPGGHWLCLAGNADDTSDPEEVGPPRLTAVELLSLAEAKFEVQSLGRSAFVLPDGIEKLAWKVLYRKR